MIKQIVLLNFRGHSRTLDFGSNLNLLCGPNEAGKSTVKEAIAFAWQGTDSSGMKNPDHLISKGQEEATVALVTDHVTLTRRKRLGLTSEVKLTRHGLTPVKMTQTELNALLKLSLDSFMSCWNAGYFMSLTPQLQLTVLGELSQVDRRELLMSMLPAGTQVPAKVKLANPKIDADAIATERRQLQNVKSSDEGALTQVGTQLAQLTAGEDVDIESYAQALNGLNASLEAHDFYKRALSKYGTDKMRYEGEMNRKGALEVGLKAAQTRLAEIDLKTYDAKIAMLEPQLKELEEYGVKLHGKRKPAPTPPKKPDNLYTEEGGICDKCGQRIDEAHVKRIMGAYEKELVEYNKLARDVATHNEKVEAAVRKNGEDQMNTIVEHNSLKSARDQLREAHTAQRTYVVDTEKQLRVINTLVQPLAPTKPDGDEVELRDEQLKLSTELNVARKQQTQLAGLRAQQELLTQAISNKAQQIDAYARLEKALRDLPEVETRKLLETLAVDGVTVGLNEGTLVICDSAGIPYPSLSSGRKMKVDLAFCAALRKAAGPRAPSWLFADNADLMDKYHDILPPGVQVFAAKVDGKLKELMVVQQ